jgi:ABC-type Fe3+/spermidine/putrescine transport system ATPase subunit
MSDRVAVLSQGKIHQVATPEQIYEHPATRFVADFIGHNNVLDATVVAVNDKTVTLRFKDGSQVTMDPARKAGDVQLSAGARVGVCVRAESLRLARDGGTFAGTVIDVEYAGAIRTCRVRTELGDLHVEVPSSAGHLVKGEAVQLSVNEAALHLVGPAHTS